MSDRSQVSCSPIESRGPVRVGGDVGRVAQKARNSSPSDSPHRSGASLSAVFLTEILGAMATDRMPAGLSTRRNGMGSSGWQRHRAGPRPLDKGEASRLYTLKSQVLLLKLGCVLEGDERG